jgi:streptomycin 6-kinase
VRTQGRATPVLLPAVSADGTPAVLKLAGPGDAADREAAALRAFDGRGAVRLLDYDPTAGALLVERAVPGHTLAGVDEERAMSIGADVARKLAREPHGPFPTVEDWRSDFARLGGLTPMASEASAVLDRLLGSMSQTFLLHGDLHHFNILANGDDWLAIDPKGLIGERECEIGPLVLNVVHEPDVVIRRIAQLSDELRLDRERARAWTFVRAILGVLWAIEDGVEVPMLWLDCAKALR